MNERLFATCPNCGKEKTYDCPALCSDCRKLHPSELVGEPNFQGLPKSRTPETGLEEQEMQYNVKGDADYYRGRIEAIRVMEQVYGTRAVLNFCECNVLKYRLRLGKKDGQDPARELIKAEWYEKAAGFFWERIQKGEEVEGIDKNNKLSRHGLPWEEENG